jgi:hypothetical protein
VWDAWGGAHQAAKADGAHPFPELAGADAGKLADPAPGVLVPDARHPAQQVLRGAAAELYRLGVVQFAERLFSERVGWAEPHWPAAAQVWEQQAELPLAQKP